jgi:general secretion pathway protein G
MRFSAYLRARSAGFTIVELLSVLTLVAILATIAVGTSNRVAESRRVKQATSDVLEMQSLIDDYILANDELPATLATAGAGSFVDPWDQSYRYLPFTTPEAVNNARKDRFLHPLNTYYDLYSIGPDGATSANISAGVSKDDVVRANDGAFVGPASAY